MPVSPAVAFMKLRTTFWSALTKPCPHCERAICLRDLKKVPREKVTRWYQFTPSPHTACPECGEFVVSTFVNSPWLLVPLLLLIFDAASAILWPTIYKFLISGWGQFILCAVMAASVWLGAKRSELIRET